PSASAAASRKPELRVSVTDASYGSLALLTSAGASCRAALNIPLGFYGEPPGTSLALQTAPASGIVRWSYAAPRVPAAIGKYDVTCESATASGSASGSFTVASPALEPTGFKVHVTTSLPPRETINTDASLVP